MSVFDYIQATPGGPSYQIYQSMTKQPHLLIAGATGSGKSVAINGLIHDLLIRCYPDEAGLILLDPKRVELVQYKTLPHTLLYSTEHAEHVEALQTALRIIDERYTAMARQGVRKYPGGDIYVIIDELADLMTTDRKAVQPLLQRIAQIGRAAKVHLVGATQCTIVQVIPTQIRCNLDSRVCLRTRGRSDSNLILGMPGCETLPRYGECFYMTPEGVEKYKLPMIAESELDRVVAWWCDHRATA